MISNSVFFLFQMRDLETIPLLLDCSSIDGTNPLITQWVVFALRNLTEQNKDNQEVLANMDDKGTVSASLAEEFGIKLQTE